MSEPPDKPQDIPAPPFNVDLFLQNQAQEIALRRGELDLRREQAQQNFEYANKALAAQLEDRERERAFVHRDRLGARILFGLMILVLALFLSIALLLDKDQIAMEIIKLIGAFLAGGIGGYALGRQQAKTNGSDAKQEKPSAS
jgi:hypothetical protein